MVEDFKKWFKKLPWYYKVPASILFLAIGVIAVLQMFKRDETPPSVADGAHNEVIKTVLDGLQDDVDESKDKVEEAKLAIRAELVAADKIDTNTGLIAERVKRANTAAELKAIVEEYDL